MKYLTAFILACFFAGAAMAQDLDYDPCEAEQTQMNMNFCAKQKYNEADKDLNDAYKKLMGMISGTFEENVRKAQRTWIKYRDEHCECARGMYEGGSIVPMVWFNCLRRMTEQRTEELNSFIEQMDM